MSPQDARLAPAPRPQRAWLARATLGLYPPAWRARYGGEVSALIDQAGGGPRTVLSLAGHALPAWVWPPRQLHDQPARMRSSLSTLLLAGGVLTGLGLVFAQLTQFQGYWVPGHPVVGVAYRVFDVALAASVLIAGAGALPLWLVMLRRAVREHRARALAWLLLPVVVPVAFVLLLVAAGTLAGGTDGVGTWWFLALTVSGFAAAAVSAFGPGLALRSLRPRGPALRLATIAACLAAATLVAATAASAVAVIGLHAWPFVATLPTPYFRTAQNGNFIRSFVYVRGFPGHFSGSITAAYLVAVTGTAITAIVSAARGARAALTTAASS
ncbi:MAG TPA: hypothetical protein VGI64_18095 [Streptosporangiaceae bacterium]|jgi:hypothetical protein